MPEVSLNPRNQCTLDDPTDGAEMPTVAPSASSANAAPSASSLPLCLAQEPDAAGASSEATDELVRNFGGSDGAGPFAPAPLAEERSCGIDTLSMLSNCGKVALEVRDKNVNGFDVASCLISVAQLAKCEFGD